MSKRKCKHDWTRGSTLHTAFTAEVCGWRFFWCYCDVCGSATHPCLTSKEAAKRAEKEWFAKKVVVA